MRMTDGVSAQDGRSGTGPGLLARVAGVLLEPRATYLAVADHPRWLGILALTLVLSAAAAYVIFSSPALQAGMLDQQIRAIQVSGGAVSDQQIAGLEVVIGFLGLSYACVTLIAGPVLMALLAGIFMTIFTTLMGGPGTFRQVFAVVAHTGVIPTLSIRLSAAMVAAGVEPTGARPPGANLGIFVPMLEETSFVASLLGTIDLFWLWWLISLGIGLGALYRRSATAIATTLLGLYAAVALLAAMLTSG
jgi:hypothetical protein